MNTIFENTKLTESSRKRLNFFWKIEELQLFVILEMIKRCSCEVFMDIGANVGFYSLAVRQHFPAAKILCFEPTPGTFNELVLNIRANQYDKDIDPLRLALSSSSGKARFLDFGESSGKNGIQSTSIHRKQPDTFELEAEINRLDNLVDFSGTRIAIKIDTEGHELDVLIGANTILSDNLCLVQIETGHHKTCQDVIGYLGTIGYRRVFGIGPDEYFSNDEIVSDSFMVSVLEAALTELVTNRWTRRRSNQSDDTNS